MMFFVIRFIILIPFSAPVLADDHVEATILEAAEIDNRLFDANHCMEKIKIAPSGDGIDFYWGCGDKKYITMECAVDRHYQRLTPRYPAAGWHCNRPLPVLKLDGVNRIADVAVGGVGEKAAWAGCFIDSYGDFNAREKPYHKTACYRALERIQSIVNQTQRDPHDVAKELLR
jgi:hypothetical protein